MMPIHDRMPAILPANDYDEWLDPANTDTETLRALLRPAECGEHDRLPGEPGGQFVPQRFPTFVERV
jgi:putative SOS response-associated peptidase YedK